MKNSSNNNSHLKRKKHRNLVMISTKRNYTMNMKSKYKGKKGLKRVVTREGEKERQCKRMRKY
jgi:hypothetical protein